MNSTLPKSDFPPRIRLGYTARDYQRYAFNSGIACVAGFVFWVGIVAMFGHSIGALVTIGILALITLILNLILFFVLHGRIAALTEQERQRGYTTRYELAGSGLWYLDSDTGLPIADPYTRPEPPARPKTFLVVIALSTACALALVLGVRLGVPALSDYQQGSFHSDGIVLVKDGKGDQQDPLAFDQKAVWSNGLEATVSQPKPVKDEPYGSDSVVWASTVTLTNASA